MEEMTIHQVLSAEPSGTLIVGPNATAVDGASVTALTEGELSTTAKGNSTSRNSDAVPDGDAVERRVWMS